MSLKKKALSGFVWSSIEQFTNKAVGFIVSILLARFILPEEFGLIGMIAIFFAIGSVLIDSGLTQSLVRSKNLDDEDYSIVFFFNVAGSVIVYLIMFVSAPFIADFYNEARLVPIIRIYCLTFIISALVAIQRTKLVKEMNFKKEMRVSIPATLVGSIIGITMAYNGYGVWSIVYSEMASAILWNITLWATTDLKLVFKFNKEKFKKHFNFGYKLTISSLIDAVFNNLNVMIIGRLFTSKDVGFYNRANSLGIFPATNIVSILGRVTYPLFAEVQDDDERLRSIYMKVMKMVMFLISPVLIFMGVLAEPLFRFLFTEKWLPAVPYFQILCIVFIMHPIHGYNLNILRIKGRSDLILRLNFIKRILEITVIIIALRWGIYGLLFAQVVNSIMVLFINTYYAGRFLKYGLWLQFREIGPVLLIAIIAGLAIFLVDHNFKDFFKYDIIRLIVGSAFGSILYLLIAFFTKITSLGEVIDIIKNRGN